MTAAGGKQQSTVAADDWESKLKLELNAQNLKTWMTEQSARQKAALNDIRQKMVDDGVDQVQAARCVAYEETPQESTDKQRLKLSSNKKTGRLNDIPTLEAAGLIS